MNFAIQADEQIRDDLRAPIDWKRQRVAQESVRVDRHRIETTGLLRSVAADRITIER